jgi:hypothetical protein
MNRVEITLIPRMTTEDPLVESLVTAYQNIAQWHPSTWPVAFLQMCHILEVKNKGEAIGYIWFSPVAFGVDRVWELHTCARPDLKGHWLTPRIIARCYDLLDELGATHCIAFHYVQGLAEMLDKLGFVNGDALSVLNVKDNNNGRNVRWRRHKPA